MPPRVHLPKADPVFAVLNEDELSKKPFLPAQEGPTDKFGFIYRICPVDPLLARNLYIGSTNNLAVRIHLHRHAHTVKVTESTRSKIIKGDDDLAKYIQATGKPFDEVVKFEILELYRYNGVKQVLLNREREWIIALAPRFNVNMRYKTQKGLMERFKKKQASDSDVSGTVADPEGRKIKKEYKSVCDCGRSRPHCAIHDPVSYRKHCERALARYHKKKATIEKVIADLDTALVEPVITSSE